MSRMQTVELVLKFGAWVLIVISTISLLIIGFSNNIAPAKIIGIIDGALIGTALLYLFAKWLAKPQK